MPNRQEQDDAPRADAGFVPGRTPTVRLAVPLCVLLAAANCLYPAEAGATDVVVGPGTTHNLSDLLTAQPGLVLNDIKLRGAYAAPPDATVVVDTSHVFNQGGASTHISMWDLYASGKFYATGANTLTFTRTGDRVAIVRSGILYFDAENDTGTNYLFQNCTSGNRYGGVMGFENSSIAYFKNALFDNNNSGTGYGGAISLEYADSATFANTSFTRNQTSGTRGGAIYSSNTPVTISVLAAGDANAVLVSGNRANGVANGIDMVWGAAATFDVVSGGLLKMHDPFFGRYDSADFIKTGAGTWQLGGASSTLGSVAVNAGTLYLYRAGEVTADAAGDAVPAGTVTAGNFSLADGAILDFYWNGTSSLPLVTATTSAVFGRDAILAASGYGNATYGSNETPVIVLTGGAIAQLPNYSFATGHTIAATDYLTRQMALTAAADAIFAKVGYAWNDPHRNAGDMFDYAHGTFTVGGSDTHTLAEPLADRADVTAATSTLGWDGKTLTKSGTGTLALTQANTYSGGTVINAGTVRATHAEGVGTGTVDLASAASALELNFAGEFDNSLEGSGNLVKTGTDTIIMSGSSPDFTTTGTTTINAGTLEVTSATALGSSAVTNNAALELDFNGTFASSIAGPGTVRIDADGKKVTMSADSTYTGATTIAAGTLRATAAAALGTSAVTNSTALELDFDGTFANSVAGAGTVEVDADGKTVAISAANTYTGATTITAGTLRATNAAALGTGAVTNNAALELDFNGIFANSVAGNGTVKVDANGKKVTMSADSTYTGVTTIAAGTLRATAAAALGTSAVTNNTALELDFNGIFANAVAGAGSVEIDAGGKTVTFSTAKAYTGTTTVTAGTLALGAANAIASSPLVDVKAGAALTASASQSFGEFLLAAGAGANFNAYDLTLQKGSLSGTLAGVGALVKNSDGSAGGGTLAIGANAAVASFAHNAGAVSVAAGTTLTAAGAASFAQGTVFSVTPGASPALAANSIAFAGTGPVINLTGYSGPDEYIVAQAATGVIGDNYRVTIAGADVAAGVTLDVYAIAGVFRNSVHSQLIAKTGLVWNNVSPNSAHGVFNILGGNAYSIDEALVNNTKTAAWYSDGLAYAWDGASLLKRGGGTLALNVANTYDGGSTIEAGTIRAGDAAALGTGAVTNNAALQLDFDGTFANSVAGNGTVEVDAANKTVTLSAVNTYTGNTTVAAGTLALSAANSLANSALVDVKAGTALTAAADQTFADFQLADGAAANFNGHDLDVGAASILGALSGVDNLAKTGGGTLTLGADVAVAGNVDIQGGVTEIALDKTLTAAGAATFADAVQINVHPSAAKAIVANSIAFSGIAGPTFNLVGYSSTDSYIVAEVDPGNQIAANYNVLVDGNPVGHAVDLDTFAFANLARQNNDTQLVATTTLAWNNTTPNTAHGVFNINDAFTIDEVLADNPNAAAWYNDGLGYQWDGASLIKRGPGTLVLTKDNTYAGPTTIEEGTLRLGLSSSQPGSLADGGVVVKNLGTLEGFGSVGGPVHVESGGSIMAGSNASSGDLGIASLTMDSGSRFLVPGAGTIVVAGTAHIDNNTQFVLAPANLSLSTPRTILSASSITGLEQDRTVQLALATYALRQIMAGGRVDLNIEIVNFLETIAAAETPNQYNTATGVDAWGGGNNPLRNYLTLLPTRADVARALDLLDNELSATAKSHLLAYNLEFWRLLSGPMREARRRAGQGMTVVDGDALASFLPGFDLGRTMFTWAQVGAALLRSPHDGNAARGKVDGYDFSVGLEGGSDLYRLGLAFRYGDARLKVDDRLSRSDIDSYNLGLYGMTGFRSGPGQWLLSAGLAGGYHKLDNRRNVVFGGFADRLAAGYHAKSIQGFAEAAYALDSNVSSRIEPYLNLTWNGLWSPNYTEEGGEAALHAESGRQNNLVTALGARFDWDITKDTRLELDLAWRHTFGKTRPGTAQFFAGDPGRNSFTVIGSRLARDEAVLGLAYRVMLKEYLDLAFGYQIAAGKRSLNQRGTASMGLTF